MLNLQPQLQIRPFLPAVVVLGLMVTALCAQTPSAKKPTGAAAKAPAATNTAPAELTVPVSVFHTPTSPQDPAKDPFFPQSTRLRSKPTVIATTTALPAVVELELKGISGAADRRLAIINSRTFAVGEEGEVPASNGRARLQVVEIKNDSVVVLLNGEQRVLRLRPGL